MTQHHRIESSAQPFGASRAWGDRGIAKSISVVGVASIVGGRILCHHDRRGNAE